MESLKNITIVGAGLSGPVMATYLSDLGYEVDLYESRHDMRIIPQSAGRSINLALSARGIAALKDIGLFEEIKSNLLAMEGRMIHDKYGNKNLQLYGQKKDEVIYSVSRSKLNMTLMDHADNTGKINIHFNHALQDLDLDKHTLNFNKKIVSFNQLLGADGASSIVRKAINNKSSINFKKEPLGHGYKELSIPSSSSNEFLLEQNALHIWPRGQFMLIALPNMDKSFTCTLFLPLVGELSFESIKTKNQVLEFFEEYFPDTIDLIPKLIDEYESNPIGKLATVYCDIWHYNDVASIFGDAAHAIVPFFGQGMNASFQDCTVMNSLVKRFESNWGKIFSEYSRLQVPNGHAIADMALENYIEMRDSVNDPKYRKRRELELNLESKFWDRFVPRYSMVSFHQIPYSKVYERGKIQMNLMDSFLAGDITKNQLYNNIIQQLVPIR